VALHVGPPPPEPDTREFAVVLRNIDTGDLVAEMELPPFPGTYGRVTQDKTSSWRLPKCLWEPNPFNCLPSDLLTA